MVNLPGLKSHRYPSNITVVIRLRRFSKTVDMILYTTLSKVVHLWLVQLSRPPFLCKGHIISTFQSTGITLLFHILAISSCIRRFKSTSPYFNIYAQILSFGTSLFLSNMIALQISANNGDSTFGYKCTCSRTKDVVWYSSMHVYVKKFLKKY